MNKVRSNSGSGAAYSTNSNPSVPIGFSIPSGPGFDAAACRASTGHDISPWRLHCSARPRFARVGPKRLWEADGPCTTHRLDARRRWQGTDAELRFADFAEAFAFLTRVAAHAEAVDHHPEFTSVWNRVDFRLTSHDAGEVTARDVALAEAIDLLARQ